MISILSTIVCNEFENKIGGMQWQKKPMYAMSLRFKLYEEDHSVPSYPNVTLLLFGYTNYIGVYYRESTITKVGQWTRLSLHDSCWRDDGVERFFQMYQERIAVLHRPNYTSWYTKKEMSVEEHTMLMELK